MKRTDMHLSIYTYTYIHVCVSVLHMHTHVYIKLKPDIKPEKDNALEKNERKKSRLPLGRDPKTS